MALSRRHLLRRALALGGILAALPLIGGCAPRISDTADDPANGAPWRCRKCGRLTRAHEDLSGERCPRCYTRNYEQVSEEDFARYLAEARQAG